MNKQSAGELDASLRIAQATALIGRSPMAIATLDEQARIIEWNEAACVLHGYSAEEICGRPYAELVPVALRGEFATQLGKIRHQRQVPRRLSRRLRADGSEVEVQFSIHGLHGDAARAPYFLTVAEDVSEQQALQSELRRHALHTQAIVETVVDGIVSIDAAGIITAVNPSIEHMFGYRGHELIGRNVKILMPEPYHSRHDGYIDNYLGTGQRKIIGIGREVEAVRKDGSVFPIDLAVSELSGSGERGFVGVMRDITERKEAARALQALNQQLTLKVEELARALEHLRLTQAQLVESEKLASLGSLVAGVSHEINTPIGVCVTAASYLSGNARELRGLYEEEKLDARGLENFLAQIEEAGVILERNLGRAAELIRSFKQVAVDRSSNLKRRFHLAEFIEELLSSLRPQLRRTSIVIEVDCDPEIEMHSMPGALSQVLTNLLQNAQIHAFAPDQPGHVRISCQVHGERLLLRFSDDGRGMSDDNLKKIFDPFFTTRRGAGGTGLGLSVTYNLVTQALGGRIQVSSKPGEGTQFELDLPLEADSDATD